MTEETKTDPYREAQAIMRRLRDPVSGCPWDRAQDFGTIVKHTIEEAYEVAEAIERGDWADVRGELGDLFFQVVFYAELGREAGLFIPQARRLPGGGARGAGSRRGERDRH